jgi:hypothetical protein
MGTIAIILTAMMVVGALLYGVYVTVSDSTPTKQ